MTRLPRPRFAALTLVTACADAEFDSVDHGECPEPLVNLAEYIDGEAIAASDGILTVELRSACADGLEPRVVAIDPDGEAHPLALVSDEDMGIAVRVPVWDAPEACVSFELHAALVDLSTDEIGDEDRMVVQGLLDTTRVDAFAP